jgi:hypothetical protein
VTARKLVTSRLRIALVVGAVCGGGVLAVPPAQAQGPEDFLRDVNSIGIGSPDDRHNSDLVGLGHVICWRLIGGEARGAIAEMLSASVPSAGQPRLTDNQADATVDFAIADLCPDAVRQ